MTSKFNSVGASAGAAEESDCQPAAVPLPVEAQGRIGRQLQQVYGQMLSEPMPDRFTTLLQNLAKSSEGNEPESA